MRRILFTLLLVIWTTILFGQNAITVADLPYLCDFEDPLENANWHMNPSIDLINTNNAWTIGSALAYGSNNALYVSSDGGVTNTYANTNNVLVAYRDVSLVGDVYDISFDWRGMGNGSKGYLKVVFCGLRESDIKCLGNSVEPAWMMSAIPCMAEYDSLNNADDWQHVQTTFRVSRMYNESPDTRLFFVWVNTDENVSQPTSVAIDNVQIAKASSNDYPTNLRVSTLLNNVHLEWDGKADSYEILYRKKGTKIFAEAATDTTFISFRNVEYGAYEFWIRGVFGTDKTVYTVFPKVYLYETDCFDALNMYNATFEYGTWAPNNLNVQGVKMIDYGSASIRSRHTTHFDPSEIDPRTITKNGGTVVAQLNTVPQGKFGSVRVGNWDSGSQYESITYSYQVESNANALLLLQYAIVLENPNHSATQQPRFTLNITDKNGNSVDTKCAYVDFHAPTAQEWEDPEIKKLWHQTRWEDKDIHWQDWNTIGISLDEYIGQELYVTFTSYDCSQGAHFGYAYFTLSCSRTDVDGIPWGNDAQAQMFTVPEGFRYAWFNTKDTLFQDTLSVSKDFPVLSSDTNKYVCHVSYLTNDECGFVLEATAKPHNVIAEVQWDWVPKDCQNGIFVQNACHIGLTNQLTGEVEHLYDRRPDNCQWTMPDGSITDSLYYNGFYVPISNEGDTLTYSLWTGVYVNDSLFQDSTVVTIVVPSIAPTETLIDTTLCYGAEIEFPVGSGNIYTKTTVVYDSLKSKITGCDSVVILNLEVLDRAYGEVFDTVCAGYTYTFAGMQYTQPGEYEHVFHSASSYGCDSICKLYLTYAEQPRVRLLNEDICTNDSLIFIAEHSDWVDSFKVVIPDQGEYMFVGGSADMRFAIEPYKVRAGRHDAQVLSYTPWCNANVDTCHFTINISNEVVVAKFNDVLAILNEQYNGGYVFESFQWYADGELIEGATESNYYNPAMTDTVSYTVAVTLKDGTSLWICPFNFSSQKEQNNNSNTSVKVVKRGSSIVYFVESNLTYQWYTLTGQCVGQGYLSSSTPWVEVPNITGWFVLQVSGIDQNVIERVVVL